MISHLFLVDFITNPRLRKKGVFPMASPSVDDKDDAGSSSNDEMTISQ